MLSTLDNIVIILENDPLIKGKLAYNDFSHRIVKRDDLPWTSLQNKAEGDEFQDSDEAFLRHYLEKYYHMKTNVKNVCDGITIVATNHKYHPIKEYLEGLSWDGINPVETMFSDYLGAEDTKYTRAVTRKILTTL